MKQRDLNKNEKKERRLQSLKFQNEKQEVTSYLNLANLELHGSGLVFGSLCL